MILFAEDVKPCRWRRLRTVAALRDDTARLRAWLALLALNEVAVPLVDELRMSWMNISAKPERRLALSSDGTPVAFTVVGSGPAVLLAHGTGLSEVVWRGLGYTAALEGFRVVGVDLRGHGRSGKPHRPRDYALATQADDLVAVLDAVDAPRAHVVGYSLGACIGFHLASRRPERVSAFVSLGGRFGALAGGADAIFSPDAVATLRTQGIDGFLNAWAAYRGAPVDSGTALAFSQNDPLALAALLGSLEGEPGLAPEHLAAITAPTLLLTGDRDAVGMRDAHEAERALPRATTTVVAGTDHAALLADPLAQAVTVQFLQHQRDGSAGARSPGGARCGGTW